MAKQYDPELIKQCQISEFGIYDCTGCDRKIVV